MGLNGIMVLCRLEQSKMHLIAGKVTLEVLAGVGRAMEPPEAEVPEEGLHC